MHRVRRKEGVNLLLGDSAALDGKEVLRRNIIRSVDLIGWVKVEVEMMIMFMICIAGIWIFVSEFIAERILPWRGLNV
jgi:hypothetical protein